jgi:hypothetical protein
VFEHRESGYNDDVQRWFHDLEITVPSIRLWRGPKVHKIRTEIDIVVDSQVKMLSSEYRLSSDVSQNL